MKIKELSLTDWLALISFFVVAGGAIAGATHFIMSSRVDYLESQLAFYEGGSNPPLPELLSDLKATNDSLSLTLDERGQLDALRVQNGELQAQIETLSGELDTVNGKLQVSQTEMQTLRDRISAMIADGETFDLAEGETAELVNNTLWFGVNYIYSSNVDITVDDRRISLGIAESEAVSLDGQECRLVLTSINAADERATFVFRCAEQ